MKQPTTMDTIPLFRNKNIVLGVCGGIAAYKIVDLASKLTQAGAQVSAILTDSATKFVGPVTFAAVTGQPALTDADLWRHDQHVPHVQLGEKADMLIVAPATANTIAKLAHGQADNLLAVTALAARCPVIVVPAMDGGMWSHAATQANVALLRERGCHVLGPAQGRMASGLVGEGRMVEPGEILGFARVVLGAKGQLAGRKIDIGKAERQAGLSGGRSPHRILPRARLDRKFSTFTSNWGIENSSGQAAKSRIKKTCEFRHRIRGKFG